MPLRVFPLPFLHRLPQSVREPSIQELFDRDVKDAYFDYDKADIRPDARDALSATAKFLSAHPQVRLSSKDTATSAAQRSTI